MKFIIFSDLQAHNYSQYSYLIDGVNSRLMDVLSVLRDIKKYAIKNGIKNILFCGDLFEAKSKIDIDVYVRVFNEFKLFKEAGLNIYGIVGNHDMYLRDGDINLHSLRPFSSVIEILNRSGVCIPNGKRKVMVYGLSFTDNLKNLIQYVNNIPNDNQYKILLLHCDIDGAKVGPNDYRLKGSIKKDSFDYKKFKWVFLGHFHNYQCITKNMLYVGSPLQHNMGDRGFERGFLVLDVENNITNRVITNSPTFIKVKYKGVVKGNFDNNFVEVRIHQKYIEKESIQSIIDKFRNKGAVFVNPVIIGMIKDLPNKSSNIIHTMNFKDMIKRYVELNGGVDSDGLQELGLSILGKVV